MRPLHPSPLPAGFALLVSLAGCVPGPPPPASQYRQVPVVRQIPLVFVPGTARLTDAEIGQLQSLGQTLPVQAVSTLLTSGSLAGEQAEQVTQRLGRPVQLVAAPGMPADQALLVISSPSIVADACRGAGVRELGTIWPSNDGDAPVLLPAGCAVAADIQAQTTRSYDLLSGRPLPPGAATPFAAAIERYYHRNDPAQSNGSQAGGQSSEQSGSEGAVQGGGPQSSAQGLLQGPLPSGAAAGQGQGQ